MHIGNTGWALIFSGIALFLFIGWSLFTMAKRSDEMDEKSWQQYHGKEGQKDDSAGILGQAENTSKDN